jgi:DNA-binding LytR/AlgR family response regulator
MFQLLDQPFPTQTRAGTVRVAVFIGLFVAAFLLFFQPFGLQKIPGSNIKLLAIAGYGLVSFLCITLNAFLLPVLFPKFFVSERWTLKREISVTMVNFLTVGFFNTLYTFLIFHQPFSLYRLLYFEAITLVVGILPVSLIVLFRHNRLLSKNLKLAQEMNSELKPHFSNAILQPANTAFIASPELLEATVIHFSSETGAEQISIPKTDFLFAVTADNYVELHYLENNLAKKSLIRSTLTRIEELLAAAPKMVRCHRAYLVNLEQVRNFSGNAQGLKLELNHTNELIPVSRKMVPEIKSLLHD